MAHAPAGKPEELASRLLALSPPGGAHTVVVRCGPDGVVLRSRQESLDLEASTKSSGHTHQAVSASPPAAETRANGSAELGLGGSKSTNSAISGVSIQAEAGWHVPAVADTSVVDVTGCGNAFCGGFLAALYHLSRQDSLELQPSRISPVPAASGPSAQSSEQGGEHVADSDRSSILARAAVWGCVAASIMAEHQGVPQPSIASFQVRLILGRALLEHTCCLCTPPRCCMRCTAFVT